MAYFVEDSDGKKVTQEFETLTGSWLACISAANKQPNLLTLRDTEGTVYLHLKVNGDNVYLDRNRKHLEVITKAMASASILLVRML